MSVSGPMAVPLYVEEQRFRQVWLWLVLVPSMAIPWVGFYYQIIRGVPFGNNSGPDWVWWVVAPMAGIGLPWLLYAGRMLTEVRSDAVVIRFTTGLFPLYRKTFSIEDIQSAEARTYRPIRDCGGWGVRMGWRGRGRVYSVSGNRGVLLTLREGKKAMIGSREAERLALAIQQIARERE